MTQIPSSKGWLRRQELARQRMVLTPQQRLIQATRNAHLHGLPMPNPADFLVAAAAPVETQLPVVTFPIPDVPVVESITISPEAGAALRDAIAEINIDPASVATVPDRVDAGVATTLEDALAELEPVKGRGRRKAA